MIDEGNIRKRSNLLADLVSEIDDMAKSASRAEERADRAEKAIRGLLRVVGWPQITKSERHAWHRAEHPDTRVRDALGHLTCKQLEWLKQQHPEKKNDDA